MNILEELGLVRYNFNCGVSPQCKEKKVTQPKANHKTPPTVEIERALLDKILRKLELFWMTRDIEYIEKATELLNEIGKRE